MKTLLTILFSGLMLGHLFAAEPDKDAPDEPIKEITKVEAQAIVFKDANRKKPLELKTEEAAAKYFKAEELKKLKTQIDFEKQVLLVFAWRGSGQDKMTYDVAESFPEQIQFNYKPGRTRDLRPHVKLYVLRNNVKWSVK